MSETPATPAAPEPGAPAEPGARSTRSGLGRLLIALYAVLAVGATVRSSYELITKFEVAPFSYLLSTTAAVVYCVITYCLIRGTERAQTTARTLMWIELAGVLVVGTLSIVARDWFVSPETGKPVSSVWFWFGRDYLWLPLILPIVGLRFLRKH
jgi:uncharacterized membrane protein